MSRSRQGLLFPDAGPERRSTDAASSTFVNNMALPVHRWFRYSAGFSAEWVEQEIVAAQARGPVRVFDPFAGSATTLVVAAHRHLAKRNLRPKPTVWRCAMRALSFPRRTPTMRLPGCPNGSATR